MTPSQPAPRPGASRQSARVDDICPQSIDVDLHGAHPSRAPIYLASVYQCQDTSQAADLLSGRRRGFVYQRNGHPNAEILAEKCRRLHQAEFALVTSSGMAALSTAVLSLLQPGQHVLLSNQLYGQSTALVGSELSRWGILASEVDIGRLDDVQQAFRPQTRMLLVETIANPLLRVADIPQLARLCKDRGAMLMVDNTFATPVVCQPLQLGADLVLESMTKMMNGHADLMLGLLCSAQRFAQRLTTVQSAWGFTSSPFDCWLADRGLSSLHLRMRAASDNALAVARMLQDHTAVEQVYYPGLPGAPDHPLARSLFVQSADGQTRCFGNMVAFRLRGGLAQVDQFIRQAAEIPFCPSLGELVTTLSHPTSTSHRNPDPRRPAEIDHSLVRLSIGIQSAEFILDALARAFEGL